MKESERETRGAFLLRTSVSIAERNGGRSMRIGNLSTLEYPPPPSLSLRLRTKPSQLTKLLAKDTCDCLADDYYVRSLPRSQVPLVFFLVEHLERRSREEQRKREREREE